MPKQDEAWISWRGNSGRLMGLAAPWGCVAKTTARAAVRSTGEPEFYINTEIVEDNDGQ
ncbi:hypothetical protein [Nitrosospira sp. Nsp14]|uniref:hypothetical protein n=1 Tax=Nitrosospira sp. Nsp14 TaxID=1855333 RepID=UPI0015A603E2|nr:hypothetical protein [Nitrosospira sp. Nsp14]